MAHSRARARLNWVFQGQCWGRCKVRRRYDPETDEFHARIVDSSEPVVTRWDDSPPEQTERPVGTFDVTPTEGGVQADADPRGPAGAVVPEGVKAELKRQAEETGLERATSTTTGCGISTTLTPVRLTTVRLGAVRLSWPPSSSAAISSATTVAPAR